MCNEKYHRTVTKGWISGYFGRNSVKIGFKKAIPQELTRFGVPRAYLNELIVNTKKRVVVNATELVFNIDVRVRANGKIKR